MGLYVCVCIERRDVGLPVAYMRVSACQFVRDGAGEPMVVVRRSKRREMASANIHHVLSREMDLNRSLFWPF